jgi:hypothetical protein
VDTRIAWSESSNALSGRSVTGAFDGREVEAIIADENVPRNSSTGGAIGAKVVRLTRSQ